MCFFPQTALLCGWRWSGCVPCRGLNFRVKIGSDSWSQGAGPISWSDRTGKPLKYSILTLTLQKLARKKAVVVIVVVVRGIEWAHQQSVPLSEEPTRAVWLYTETSESLWSYQYLKHTLVSWRWLQYNKYQDKFSRTTYTAKYVYTECYCKLCTLIHYIFNHAMPKNPYWPLLHFITTPVYLMPNCVLCKMHAGWQVGF